jgi:quinol monooxygenase YgiN
MLLAIGSAGLPKDAGSAIGGRSRRSGRNMPGPEGRRGMELTIEIRPRPGKFQELYQTLQALLPSIRNEKRCRDCRISLDGEVLSLSSDWKAPAGLESYMRSTGGIALLGAIDVLSERAAVKTGRDAPEGIDVLKRMRRK